MDNEIRNVKLSFCCKEDWNSFATVDARTRFCASCRCKVLDFRNAKQQELTDALKSGGRVCGVFKRSQMNEAFLKYAAASLLAVSSAVSSCSEESLTPVAEMPLEEQEIEFTGDVDVIYEELDIPFTGYVTWPDSTNTDDAVERIERNKRD